MATENKLMRILFAFVAVAIGSVSTFAHEHQEGSESDSHHAFHAKCMDDHVPVGFDVIRPYQSHGRGICEPHGHAGHTSIEGYPFVHGIRTEIDFIERALEFDLVRTQGADNGEVDEWEFESELVWAINSRPC